MHTHDTRQCAASDSNRSGYRPTSAGGRRYTEVSKPRLSRYETTSGPTGQRCSCRRTLSLGRIASCAHPTQPTPPPARSRSRSARSDRGVPLADARSACAPPVLAHGRTAVGLRTWSRRGQSSRSSWCRPKRKQHNHASVSFMLPYSVNGCSDFNSRIYAALLRAGLAHYTDQQTLAWIAAWTLGSFRYACA